MQLVSPVHEYILERAEIAESIYFDTYFLLDLPDYGGATRFPELDSTPKRAIKGLTFDFVMTFENKQ